MNEDHIKRFNLSENRPQKPFSLSNDKPTIKTKDNVQPVIPPPRTVFLPHPQLAPPGMMGSRLASDAAKWVKDKPPPAERTFKPFVRSPDKDWTPHR